MASFTSPLSCPFLPQNSLLSHDFKILTSTLFRLDHTCFAESAIAVELDDADAEIRQ